MKTTFKKKKGKEKKNQNEFADNINAQEVSWDSSEEKEGLDDVEEFPTDLREYEEKPVEVSPEVKLQYLKDLFYDSEDSENERELNTIGNVPLKWYDDYDHMGYDIEGKKILRPKREDQIDKLLAQEQNPWSVYNEKTGKRELISASDMDIIQRIKKGLESDRYAPDKWYIELNQYTDPIHPAANIPAPKSRFIPSRWEAKRVRRLAFAVRKGWLKLEEAKPTEKPKFYQIWDDSDQTINKGILNRHIPAPKQPLPGHNESYNPPEEYLMDEEEKKEWILLDPEDRLFNFIPEKNSSLRTTPSYDKFQRERFERCLDLYLAIRSKKKKMWVDPETLVPKIPKPSELRPYPTQEAIRYVGHEDYIRSIDVDPTGQWLISGSDDKTVRIWEISTGRQVEIYKFPSIVHHVEWNPNPDLFMFGTVTDSTLYIFHPTRLSNVPQKANTEQFFKTPPPNNHNERIKNLIEWQKPDDEISHDIRLKINFKGTLQLKFMTWHYKGDYFATVCPEGNKSAVLVHQLSRMQSQNPFSKSKGYIQCVSFHPSKPYFFVATQRHIRIYNLEKQILQKKLLSGTKWISSIHVHPGGDNVIMGSFDRRVCWFDLDLSSKPYKILRYHKYAVRSTRFHQRYPLFASCSDDGCIHVFHGMVYNDLLQNPFIVPLKVLRGHEIVNDLGVLDIVFHPYQPWIFSAGADATLRFYI